MGRKRILDIDDDIPYIKGVTINPQGLWPLTKRMKAGDSYIIELPDGMTEARLYKTLVNLCKTQTGKSVTDNRLKLISSNKSVIIVRY